MLNLVKAFRCVAGFGVLACALMAVAPAKADGLLLLTEEYPPFNLTRNGEVSGLATDVLREVMKRTRTEHRFVLGPWQRSYATALEQPGACVYSTTVTDARKPLFKWVQPLVEGDWVLFGKQGTPIVVNSLEEARKYRIGVYQGDALEVHLKEVGGFTLDSANRDALNAAKLDAGRIDLWATGVRSGPWLAALEKAAPPQPLLTIRRTVLGLACNPATETTVVERLQAALDAMIAEGVVETFAAAYR
jgi:polar amino acid transport system substrate-binding protein